MGGVWAAPCGGCGAQAPQGRAKLTTSLRVTSRPPPRKPHPKETMKGTLMAHLTSEQIEDLQGSLSAAFSIYMIEEWPLSFLLHLIDHMDGYTVATAAQWGWGDTEVREGACATAQKLFGVDGEGDDNEKARVYYAAWARNQRGL